MSSEPDSSWWGDLFRSCLPSTRRRTTSTAPSTPGRRVASLPVNPLADPPQTNMPMDTLAAPASNNRDETQSIGIVAWEALSQALRGLESGLEVFPPLKNAVGGLVACVSRFELVQKNKTEYQQLASSLAALAGTLQSHLPESKSTRMPYSISNVARAIEEQTARIKQHQDQHGAVGFVMAKEDEEHILSCYRRIEELFRRLQVDISLSIWTLAHEQWVDTRLKDLTPTHDAHFNSALPMDMQRRGCTPDTRKEALAEIQRWTRDETAAAIYWMNGMAGTGKTTIAYSLCEKLECNKQLGASFFCSRVSSECSNVNRIVPTIAYQLGRFSNPYQKALCEVLGNNPDVARRNIVVQFQQLIVEPLTQVKEALPKDVVVAIDALDECTDIKGTSQVLGLLFNHAADLPIKFFITSRPEPGIINQIMPRTIDSRAIMQLHDIERSLVQADIKTYLAEALGSISLSGYELDQLADRAGNLFIFAATAVRYILPNATSVNYRSRLEIILGLNKTAGSKSYRDIDKLYSTILSSALDHEILEDIEVATRRLILGAVICVREPLTTTALAELLALGHEQDVTSAIQPLRSVLYFSEQTKIVSTLHASFPDFLLSLERAGPFYCNAKLYHGQLATLCFNVMKRSLRFNICQLETSYRLDRDVPDLQSRVNHAISLGVFYTCHHWADHMSSAETSDDLVGNLEGFLRYRLLFWMEVLNLKACIGHGDDILSRAIRWLPSNDLATELLQFLSDARNFITTFAANPVSASTPHLYVSVLPFTPKQNHIRSTYLPRTHGLIRVEGTAMEARGSSALATWAVGGEVYSIAQSSDGKRVASGSGDSMLKVWDVSKGTCILGPLEGHKGGVNCVAFSPDDMRIASASDDRTIRLWDSHKGIPIAGPLEGHTSAVRCVAFSPDNTRLASSSSDHTIRMWDAYTGAPIGEVFEGHQGTVWSVAFSPDGKHLASAADDRTVRVWDSHTGTMIAGPFEGHTEAVNTVAFTYDGLRLATGSDDRTVRVWDVQSSMTPADPFEGHTRLIWSVAFSPSGTQVVSGSRDQAICVWNVLNGALLAGPLRGHQGDVRSVLFTSDGTRILSGSSDGTIRVWDARHGATSAAKSSGHTGAVHSVSYSPNGTRAVSGSSDHTICVWDTGNGGLVAGLFQGHTGEVRSVVFSPDGAWIVSGSDDRTLRTWDARTGALLAGPFEGHAGSVRSVAFSPNGGRIASGSEDCTIRMWDSHGGASLAEPFEGHASWVMSVAFSPDGAYVISGSFDCTVRMWDANDATAPRWTSHAHTSGVGCVAFSADGTRVVSGSGYTILVLNARDGTVLHGPLKGHANVVFSVGFSPDGTRVVSGSEDCTVRVWDVQSGKVVIGPLKGHTAGVNSVAFSPDGSRILSGSDDGTIRFWDLATAGDSSLAAFRRPLNEDGWMVDSDSRLLLWVPSDLRNGFPYPSNPFLVTTRGVVQASYNDLRLGERWHECYCDPPKSGPPSLHHP